MPSNPYSNPQTGPATMSQVSDEHQTDQSYIFLPSDPKSSQILSSYLMTLFSRYRQSIDNSRALLDIAKSPIPFASVPRLYSDPQKIV